MSDILKEAIADAKAVRETALENAKMALEEAFTPQIKSMLSAKLKEDEIEESDPVVEDEELEDDEGEAEEGYSEDDEIGDEEVSDEEEIPAEEGYSEDDEAGDDEVAVDDEEEVEEENLDLEAIIKELESELSEDAVEEGEEVEESTEASDETVDEGEETVEESDEPVEESTEEVDEEIEIDENALTEEDDEDEDEEVEESNTSAIEAELKEYKEAVSFLKDKLHEVNILNAKLLFTNKLFKAYSLDNNQKLKVVETFDRAQTTREIKLVYSTLAEQFQDNGSIVTKKSISESASAPVSSTKPSKESRKVISEETQVADRFKKLAGLIK